MGGPAGDDVTHELHDVPNADPAPGIELSVVVPAHNEQDNILPLFREICAALEGHVKYEVIFVDDGSTDATLSRLARASGESPALRVLRHEESSGQSTAIHTGVAAARGRWIATLDGDGQNDPADIVPLLHAMRDPARPPALRMIVGQRARRHDSVVRLFSSRVANAVRGRMLGDGTPDTGCGLKLFERDLFLALPYFDHMHRFLPALAQRAGSLVRSVPVSHRPRAHGRSHYGIRNRLWVGLVDLCGVMWLARRAATPVVHELSPDQLASSARIAEAGPLGREQVVRAAAPVGTVPSDPRGLPGAVSR
jgi:dolichol-phosphate mannosyltransferase